MILLLYKNKVNLMRKSIYIFIGFMNNYIIAIIDLLAIIIIGIIC